MSTEAKASEAAAMKVAMRAAPAEPPAPEGSIPAAHPHQGALAEFLRDSSERCPGCGYGLRGLATAVCPECGRELRLTVDAGARGRGWWLFATMGASAGAAMAAGLLWMELARVAEYYTTTNMAMVKSGFQPRLNVRWHVLIAEGAATVILLGIAAWAGALRAAFARRAALWRLAIGVALGAMPMAVVGLVWVWGKWRE